MANKPLTLPEWASGGSAQIVEPASGKKAVGHVPGEPPPAQYELSFASPGDGSPAWIASAAGQKHRIRIPLRDGAMNRISGLPIVVGATF